jgi:hypothetical protein
MKELISSMLTDTSHACRHGDKGCEGGIHGSRHGSVPDIQQEVDSLLLWHRLTRIIAVSEAVRRDILTRNSWYPPEKAITIHSGKIKDRPGGAFFRTDRKYPEIPCGP